MIKLQRISDKSLAPQIAELYRAANFLSATDDASFLSRYLESSLVVGAFDNDRLIGTGRAVTDFVSDAYIQDVTVDVSYRRQGIGSEIINFLINELSTFGVDWIGLVGVPGSEEFYRSLGFKQMDGHTAYLLK